LWERIVANIHPPENEQACWEWAGNVDRKGYGRLSLRLPGKRDATGVRVTRLVLGVLRAQEQESDELFILMDPDEETVEHLCCNTCCVNPDHLVILTRGENAASANRRRAGQRVNAE
jgi:hypothetical protein